MNRQEKRVMSFDGVDAIVSTQCWMIAGSQPDNLGQHITAFVNGESDVAFAELPLGGEYRCSITIWRERGNVTVKTSAENYSPGTASATVRHHIDEMMTIMRGSRRKGNNKHAALDHAARRHALDVAKGLYDYPYAELNRAVNRMEEQGIGRASINNFLDALAGENDDLKLMVGQYGIYRDPLASQEQTRIVSAAARSAGLDLSVVQAIRGYLGHWSDEDDPIPPTISAEHAAEVLATLASTGIREEQIESALDEISDGSG